MSEQKTTKEHEAKQAPAKHHAHKKLAVILIRGLIGIPQDGKDNLFMMRLRKKHTCVVLEETESNKGMIKKVKDFITYGEINEETLKMLTEKRGKADPNNKGHIKKFFELAPPKGGFERKGIKKNFKQGGALGYRGEKINDLLKRMI